MGSSAQEVARIRGRVPCVGRFLDLALHLCLGYDPCGGVGDCEVPGSTAARVGHADAAGRVAVGPLLYQEVYYGKPIAYGYDTFEPVPFRKARADLNAFPDPKALNVLQSWGVRYVVVSANAYGADWPGTLDYLESLPALKHLGDFQEQRTWQVDPAVLDAQPDMAPLRRTRHDVRVRACEMTF